MIGKETRVNHWAAVSIESRFVCPSVKQKAVLVAMLAVGLLSSTRSMAQSQAQPVDPAETVPAEGAAPSSSWPDAPSTTQATQSHGFGGSAATVAKTIGEDELHFLKYPFQKSAIKWDILFLGATGVLIANDESVLHQVPQSWHNNSITVSNATLGATAATAGGIYLTGLITHNDHAEETGVRTAEATIDSVILYGAAKAIFARQRPFTGEGEGKFFSGNWTNGSFPSGHAMFTWTIASTVAHEYHSPWVKILMYGLATTVSTARVTAREHFPSDVFVGSVLGYGIGAYVAHKDNAIAAFRAFEKQDRARAGSNPGARDHRGAIMMGFARRSWRAYTTKYFAAG